MTHMRRVRPPGADIGDAAKVMCVGVTPLFAVHIKLTPPMSLRGGLARRICGDAFTNGMPATSSRKHSPPNNMARHRTLRRAMKPVSAQMPRRLCLLGQTTHVDLGKFGDAECADAAYVGARRPRKALLRRRYQ
jgi:hypothetical protein